jgi:hypothetical protein
MAHTTASIKTCACRSLLVTRRSAQPVGVPGVAHHTHDKPLLLLAPQSGKGAQCAQRMGEVVRLLGMYAPVESNRSNGRASCAHSSDAVAAGAMSVPLPQVCSQPQTTTANIHQHLTPHLCVRSTKATPASVHPPKQAACSAP